MVRLSTAKSKIRYQNVKIQIKNQNDKNLKHKKNLNIIPYLHTHSWACQSLSLNLSGEQALVGLINDLTKVSMNNPGLKLKGKLLKIQWDFE